MIVTEDMVGIRKAVVDLFVESLHQEDADRVASNLLVQEADPETLAKGMPVVRELAAAFYDYASYLLWLRRVLDAGVTFALSADEAEGLVVVLAARQEFERQHPACPRCGMRQYSATAMRCRNGACRLDFKKGS